MATYMSADCVTNISSATPISTPVSIRIVWVSIWMLMVFPIPVLADPPPPAYARMCAGRMAGLECHFKAKIGIAVGCTLDGGLSGMVGNGLLVSVSVS